MTFKVKLVSQINAIALLVILLSVFLAENIIFNSGGFHNELLSILSIFFYFLIAYFLWQKFVIGICIWTIDSHQISISWLKKFSFTSGKDLNITWDEIESISKGIDPQYYNLRIKLTSGEKIVFYHDYLTTKDDFQQLIESLNQTFKKIAIKK